MTADDAQLAVLIERVVRQRDDLNGLGQKVSEVEIEQREEKSIQIKLGAAVDNLQKSFGDVVSTVHELGDDMTEIKEAVAGLKVSLDQLNDKKVDWPKVFRFFSTGKGLLFLGFIAALLLGTFSPPAQDFIIQVLQMVLPDRG